MKEFNSKPKHSGAGKAGAIDVLRFFWRAVKYHKTSLFVVISGVVLARIVIIIVPIFYKRFFDTLSMAGSVDERAVLMTQIIFWILGLNILNWAGYRVSSFSVTHFESMVIAKLKQQAFDYMINHSYSFYANNFTGSLVQRVNRFARAFETLADRITYDIIPLAIDIIGVSIVLWFTNPVITLILVVWVIIFLGFNFFFSRWKLKYDIRRAEMDSFTTGVLSDSITNQNTIQLFTGAGAESKNFKKVTDDQAKFTRFTWNLQGMVDSVQSMLLFIIEFALFYYAIKYWQQGVITVGTFVLIQVYLVGLGIRLWDFSRVVRNIYEGFADAKEMVDILLLKHDINDVPNAKELSVPQGEVKFDNVGFGFNSDRMVLKELNLTIKPGEKVALIGPSGAGKSTFVKLLMRFYDVSSGGILVDGQNISEVTQESLRRNVSLVPQDPILFHRTLLENIRYGRRNSSDSEVLEAARLAHCDEFALSLTDGYNTYVGERGIKLSGGERQRVAIARAILKNAPILILDEATSSLDSHSEAMIQDALDKLMKGKTTIVIAHRLSTIRKMDRIIVLDHGRIIEEGNHDQLLQKDSSLYAKLWNLQAGGFVVGNEN